MKFLKNLFKGELQNERFVEEYNGISIRGSQQFIDRTKPALDLLESSKSFQEIKGYIRIVGEGLTSGMHAESEYPTFEVGNSTSSANPKWYASCIAHDTYHSKLYKEGQSLGLTGNELRRHWTGRTSESKCLSFQKQVLVEIEANNGEIEYINKLIKNPHVDNEDYTYSDYLSRMSQEF